MVAVSQNQSRRPRPITIDTEAGVVAPDRIFIHRSTKGYVCVGIGTGGALLERAARPFDRSTAKLVGATRTPSNDLYLERLALLVKGYNPDEARVPAGNPGGGEWTAGGVVMSAASAAASLFETDSASVAAGLATIASRLSAPTALFGTLFIPTNRSLISSGLVPGNANTSFQFDRGTGVLRLSRSDNGSVLFSGRYGADGIFRDNNGNAFGRVVDGAVVLDPDTLPGYASSRQPAQSRASAQAQTDTDRGEPELCPDPSLDRPGSVRGIAYQAYIAGLINPELPTPPGMAVRLYNPVADKDVYFDDCRRTDGVMIEAKGPGYEKLIKSGRKSQKFKAFIDKRFLDQASRQFDAAQGRPIEWYFAEKGAADYFRELFDSDSRLNTIKTIYMPMPQ